jgi:hypothetical protein
MTTNYVDFTTNDKKMQFAQPNPPRKAKEET